ncbi:ATP-dependent nuclease [Microbacterium sp.]|uniref:ATP-dependent nuclease n=1 Tax=Microbacterium sp. TaxID=51671 RepID=UPI003A8CC297
MKLLSVRLENIGGFSTTEFSMKNDLLLIGENNSGKTSLLRVVDWVLNQLDQALLEGRRELSIDEAQLLLPARATRNRARRLFLRVHIPDGRTARKYSAEDGVAEVRVQFRADANFARLGSPTRGEEPASDPKAIDLIDRLQEAYVCLYVPAARDGRSTLFRDVMRSALRDHLTSAMLYDGHGRPAGAPKKILEAATALSTNANTFASNMWKDVLDLLQGGFEPRATFEASISSSLLIELAIDQMSAKFSIGDHDANAVPIEYLGAGLQSVLALALAQLSTPVERRRLFLIEEPEAFLHPSAQRTIGQQILNQPDAQTIATTHSSAILAEARPASVVVLRGHVAYPATPVSDLQDEKDTHLLASSVHAAMFDRSILLVEGAGDVAFLEVLRRRLHGVLPARVLNRMRVCSVGSKTSFGPWLRLLRRYLNPTSGSHAYNLLVCADSIDAGADVKRALRESGVGTIPVQVSSALDGLAASINAKDPSPQDASIVATRTIALNSLASQFELPLHLSSVDLEYSILEGISDARAAEFAVACGHSSTTRDELMADMGSKGGSKRASEKPGAKAPHVRASLARWIEWSELSSNVKELVWRWTVNALDAGEKIDRPSILR